MGGRLAPSSRSKVGAFGKPPLPRYENMVTDASVPGAGEGGTERKKKSRPKANMDTQNDTIFEAGDTF